jgi:hypothetical protein
MYVSQICTLYRSDIQLCIFYIREGMSCINKLCKCLGWSSVGRSSVLELWGHRFDSGQRAYSCIFCKLLLVIRSREVYKVTFVKFVYKTSIYQGAISSFSSFKLFNSRQTYLLMMERFIIGGIPYLRTTLFTILMVRTGNQYPEVRYWILRGDTKF